MPKLDMSQPEICTILDILDGEIENTQEAIPEMRTNGEADEVVKHEAYLEELAAIRQKLVAAM